MRQLNADPTVHGILVQLPLPKPLDARAVIEAIDPAKDVDGFHYHNVGALVVGEPAFYPCTPWGVMKMLEHEGIAVEGRHAVIVGRSTIVGKPMAMMLVNAGATVTVCHSKTRDLAAVTRQADILVAAVGRARMIGGDMVKPGAVVIDVGINRLPDGKLCGDVDYASVAKVASRDHAGAGRRGADDDRDAGGQHGARRGKGGGTRRADRDAHRLTAGRSRP